MFKKIFGLFKRNNSFDGSSDKKNTISVDEVGFDSKLLSKNSLYVAKELNKNGFFAAIVGGAVRDILLKIKPKDFDVVTNAKPNEIKKIFKRARIIGRRFKLVHVFFRDEIIEVSTFRSKSEKNITYDPSGRIIRDNSFGKQDEDAARRDLSINALYFDPIQNILFDFHNGIVDINDKRIRVIGNPSLRFREDPIRMLRVIRFAVRLNFQIDPKVKEIIKKNSSLIRGVPKSRIIDETIKLFLTGNSSRVFLELLSTNLHKFSFPFIDYFENKGFFPTTKVSCASFLSNAFFQIDRRVTEKKTISIGFILACLLWYELEINWKKNIKNGDRTIIGLSNAISKVAENLSIIFPVQRKHLADMKEIWRLQPRFEKTRGKAPLKLTSNAKFRVAFNFLKLRVQSDLVGTEILVWWNNYLSGENINKRNTNNDKFSTQLSSSKRKHNFIT